MNYFEIVLQQIGIFAVYSCIGVLAVKGHVINRQGLNDLSRIITKIVLPLMIFSNTINGTTRQDFISSLSILLLAAVMYTLCFLLGLVLAKLLHLKGEMRKVYRACVMFGNCGFMGIPLVIALFAERGAIYMAVYSVVDQLALWTVGMQILTSGGQQEKRSLGEIIRKLVNPATVALAAGLVLLLTGIQLPEFVNTALTKTGAAATPLAMLYLGGMFCYTRIGTYLRHKEIYAMVIVKMILLPLLTSAVLSRIPGVSTEIAVTVSLICALPSMTSVAMIADSQGSDSEYASAIIFITTLISMVTLPLVCMFL